MGIERSGICYYPKHAMRRNDIKISVPINGVFLSGEIGITKNNKKFSIGYEMKNIGEGMGVINDSAVTPIRTVFRGIDRHSTGGTISFIGVYYDRYSKINKNISWLKWYYGVGVGIGFNRTDAYYRETQNAGYSSFASNDYYLEMWNKPTGHGIFLKFRGGLSVLNKKRREVMLLEVFWNQGLRKMLDHTVNYGYGYPPNPSSWHRVYGLKYSNRGTSFGACLGFPVFIKQKKKSESKR
jgi:hypothetical protein